MALTRITKGVIKPNENYDTHNINSTGIVTATGANITGNLTVGGVLTYEDVTSIDSVGIVTGAAGDFDDFVDVGSNIKLGNAGVITATSFVGSGAALTGIDATAIKDSGGNVKIQAQASGAIHSGVSTFQDLDVDGHTNLDNVSVAGVTTFASDVGIAQSIFHYNDTNTTIGFSGNDQIKIHTGGGERLFITSSYNWLKNYTSVNTTISADTPTFHVRNNTQSYHTIWESQNTNARSTIFQWNDYGNSSTAGNLIFRSRNSPYVEHARFTGAGNFNLLKDLDVDGHTNLDNVSIAGMTTTTGNLYLDGGNINVGTGVTIKASGEATYTGIVTASVLSSTGQIKLPDGTTGSPYIGNLELGNSRDFTIVHDSNHTYMVNRTGDLYVGNSDSSFPLRLKSGNSLELYYTNTKVLETSASAITIPVNLSVTGTIETTGSHLKITGAEPRLTFTDTDNNPDFQIWANAQKFSIYDSTNSATRINIDSVGHVCINTTTEGNPNADDFTISFNNQGVSGGDQGRCGMTIRSGSNTSSVAQPGYIYFSDGTSGDNESKGVVAYDHNVDDMYFSTNGVEKLRIKSDGNIVHNSTTALQLAKGTTAQRPSGVDGMIRFNTTLAQTEEYRDSGWHGLSNKSVVSGGTITTSGAYTIHTFTSSGTLTVTGASKTGVDYLLVAGGGGGGDTRAGGGGGGGMTETTGATLATGSYTITIGAGGAGGTSSANGTDGGATSLGSVASVVGGGGGGGQGKVGRSGGSGGGGSDGQNGASGTSGQGNSGGNSSSSAGGGGGGGKDGAGNSTTGQTLIGGAGGAAGASNFSGSTVNYSGGGGGGSRDNGTYGNGGGGGAGRGGQNNSTGGGQSASANQGGGGGGGARLHGSAGSTYNGGAGGSGIVIIRYLT